MEVIFVKPIKWMFGLFLLGSLLSFGFVKIENDKIKSSCLLVAEQLKNDEFLDKNYTFSTTTNSRTSWSYSKFITYGDDYGFKYGKDASCYFDKQGALIVFYIRKISAYNNMENQGNFQFLYKSDEHFLLKAETWGETIASTRSRGISTVWELKDQGLLNTNGF